MNKKIEITNSLGQKVEADIITVFKVNSTNKDYIVYTFNEKDSENNYKTYTSRLRETDGQYFLDAITDDNEWLDVKNIIRIGSAGSMNENVKLRDVVAAVSAYTDSNYGDQFGIRGHLAPCASFELLSKAVHAGNKIGTRVICGPIYSSDAFYDESQNSAALRKMGVLAVEMESYALYLNAARAGKSALCLCTISDSLITGESLPAEERQNSFTDMMKIALEIA